MSYHGSLCSCAAVGRPRAPAVSNVPFGTEELPRGGSGQSQALTGSQALNPSAQSATKHMLEREKGPV